MRKGAFGLAAILAVLAMPVPASAGDGLGVLGLESEPPPSAAPAWGNAPPGGRGFAAPLAAPQADPPDLPEAAREPAPAPAHRKASRALPPIEASGPRAPGWGKGGARASQSAPPPAPAEEPGAAVAQPQSAALSILPQQPAPTAASAAQADGGEPPQAGPDREFQKQEVDYSGSEAPGSLVIDTNRHFLFLVEPNGQALRYGVGVGRPGFEWAGIKTVTRKAEWPEWIPPDDMLKRRPDLPKRLPGGPHNPLGARALYLGSSLYRIHGTNDPSTIGQDVSSGCIRMTNADVIDLYDRVAVGTKVVVR